MLNFTEIIAESVSGALREMGVQEKLTGSDIEIPPDKALGHFAFPCFRLSKQLKKSPVIIAEEIGQHIRLPVFIESLSVQSGYLNFWADRSSYRYERYHFSRCLYVVGQPQALHFRQVFKTLKLLGHSWADRCEHVGYSHIRFADGKLSTRSGNVVSLEDILNRAVQMAYDRLSKENVSAADLSVKAEIIGIGAVKYAFLKNSRDRDILFDWDEIMDFQGDSAPYIQYTYARCKSILRKSATAPPSAEKGDFCDEEFELVQLLCEQEQTLSQSLSQNEPSVAARYVYRLARAFNRFYHTCPVLGSSFESQRLQITQKTAAAIAEFLGLLGIGVVEQM